MKKLVSIGCSFTYGDGLVDKERDVYGNLVATYYNLDHVNLAVQAASNAQIALQGQYALENIDDIDTFVIGVTSVDRFDIVPDSANIHHFDLATFLDYKNGNLFSTNVTSASHSQSKLSTNRYKILENYAVEIYNQNLKSVQDFFSLGFIIYKIIERGIKVVIVADSPFFQKYFLNYTVNLNFFKLSIEYPDVLNTGHCDEYAHTVIANECIKTLNK